MSESGPFVPLEKRPKLSAGILPAIGNRWSPYAFTEGTVPREVLSRCFEAASWAASSYNEQPWTFLIAYRESPEAFERMLSCLLEANQSWARQASALILAVSQETFSRNGTPNRVHQYDLGQAVAHFTLQATAEGLAVHQMAGIHIGKIRAEYQIPDGYAPQTAIAVGYAAESPTSSMEEEFIRRDRSPRTRKQTSQFVFEGTWGKP